MGAVAHDLPYRMCLPAYSPGVVFILYVIYSYLQLFFRSRSLGVITYIIYFNLLSLRTGIRRLEEEIRLSTTGGRIRSYLAPQNRRREPHEYVY